MRERKGMLGNETVFLIVSVFYGLGGSFLSEGYIQTYLLELGMSVQQIGLYGILGNAGAVASYALFSFYKPRNGSFLTPLFITSLGITIFPIVLALTSLVPRIGAALLLFNAAYQFLLGFRTSSDYCVVPMVMPRSHYGKLSSKCGMIGSGLAALVSVLSAAIMRDASAMSGYMTIFISAAAALLISAGAVRFYRPMNTDGEMAQKADTRGKRLTRRSAWILFPHLLRGIACGGLYYYVVISLQRVTLSSSQSSLIVTIGVVGAMLGCAIFMFLEKYMKTGTIILLSNAAVGLCALLTAFNVSPIWFLVIYFVYVTVNNTSCYAIPAGVVYVIPGEELPFISSMRMLMMTGGSTVFIQVFSMLMNVWPSWTVMAISALVYIAAGVVFKLQFTDTLKKSMQS